MQTETVQTKDLEAAADATHALVEHTQWLERATHALVERTAQLQARLAEAEAALREIQSELEAEHDTEDGRNGEPRPNWAMRASEVVGEVLVRRGVKL